MAHKFGRVLRFIFAISLAVSILAAMYLAWTIEDSRDLVRLRNALNFEARESTAFNWTPSDVPSDFLWEKKDLPDELVSKLFDEVLATNHDADGLARSLLIAGHLASAPSRSDKPIQSSTPKTFELIVNQGIGFCSDYTQVMNGLAHSANIPIREWGMSFDSFSGNGHAFSEIYDFSLNKWVFLDSYFSFYVINRLGQPMSAMEFRSLLDKQSFDEIEVVPIRQLDFMFPSSDHALQYYARGADSFFMYWGNNVNTYDSSRILNILGSVSRAAQQGAAIVLGLQPKIVIGRDWANPQDLAYLSKLRIVTLTLVFSSILATLIFGYMLYVSIRQRRTPVNES